jgi:hypothetical protein
MEEFNELLLTLTKVSAFKPYRFFFSLILILKSLGCKECPTNLGGY